MKHHDNRVEPSSFSEASLPPSRSSAGQQTAAGFSSTAASTIHHPHHHHSSPQDDDQRPPSQPHPPPSRRGRKGFTVHWPFQSIATDTLSVFTSPAAPELFRRATWQPPKQPAVYDPDDDDDGRGPNKNDQRGSQRDSTLIPDYVVNFIRGETPETVARRKRNGGHQGMRAVDITHQHRPQRSHMALFEGDRDARSLASATTDSSTMTELQQILPGGGHGHFGGEKGFGEGLGADAVGWRRMTTGWRSGVLLNLLLITAILVAGFVCLVVAGTRIALLVGDMELFTGTCAAVATTSWGLHALVNVAVVVLLVGANYVFQVLSSPTRTEVAAAHARRAWLEIGVPSARNFAHIGRGRALLALVVLAVAVATQIIYNALIFTTATGYEYDVVAVAPAFLAGGQFSNASAANAAGLARVELLRLQDAAAAGGLANLSTAACVDVFSASFNADYQALLLVLDSSSSGGSSSSSSNSLVATARVGIGATAALDDMVSTTTSTTNGATQILVEGSGVAYCLGERAAPTRDACTLNLNGILFAAILALNLVAFLATAAALVLRRFEPLVTLGDAVSSFLRHPDSTTRGNCLLTKENLRTGLGGWGFAEGKYWAPDRGHAWFRSPSLAQWLVAGFWWLAAAGPAGGVLALTLIGQQQQADGGSISTASTTMKLTPFGTADYRTTYLTAASTPAAALALAAAGPQVLLAGLYLATNALLTAFYLTRESARFAATATSRRRALRVSNTPPVGRQTTSLYLTLPRPVSWALAAYFAAMGLVLSQACFPVCLSSPSSSSSSALRGVGFSGAALLTLLLMLVALLVVVVALSLRRAPAMVMADGRAVGNPLVFDGGSCSAVVSARCHRVPAEVDVWADEVCWGVVPELGRENMVAHATYSARPVAEMDSCHRYM